MLTMTKPNEAARKRSDHRKEPYGGRFGDYLIHEYPQKMDYVPGLGRREFEQSYHTERAGGRFVHVEAGKPAMKEAFIDALSGFPWQVVKNAIEVVRKTDAEAIAALEWAQTRPTRRPTRYEFALAHHVTEQTLSGWLQRAIRKVNDELPDCRHEWNNPSDEERAAWKAGKELA